MWHNTPIRLLETNTLTHLGVQLSCAACSCWSEYDPSLSVLLSLQVVLAANDLPSINDVTYTELIEIVAKVVEQLRYWSSYYLYSRFYICIHFLFYS